MNIIFNVPSNMLTQNTYVWCVIYNLVKVGSYSLFKHRQYIELATNVHKFEINKCVAFIRQFQNFVSNPTQLQTIVVRSILYTIN